MTDKYQKIPDGKGGFKFIKSDKGAYTKDDLEKKENDLQKRLDKKENDLKKQAIKNKEVREKAIKSNKNQALVFWSILFIIFGSCWLAVNDISNNSPTIDPAKVLSPQERKDICYELYNTPEERAALLACIARVNSDS
jgi:hypothetical protein